MNTNIYISEIVATRLSHDLIGNIGAVANAVELLNEGDEDDREDIGNILNFSSKVLSRRLKFFRLCFGMSNAAVKTTEELATVMQDYLLTLGNPNLPTTLALEIGTPKIYKLVMPAVMMMADTIVKGGKIAVKQTDDGRIRRAAQQGKTCKHCPRSGRRRSGGKHIFLRTALLPAGLSRRQRRCRQAGRADVGYRGIAGNGGLRRSPSPAL